MSTDSIYLKSFRATNFRAYGDVAIEFPPGPGVVVLDGPNGLGKTTWFEAVEMALCGKVHRWDLAGADQKVPITEYVTREAAGENAQCRLGLVYAGSAEQPGLEVTWDRSTPHLAGLGVARNPEAWSLNASNLSGFLRGTHLVPQSPVARLLQMSGKDLWESVLSCVSGYSDIETFSTSVQGVKSPLTTRSNNQTKATQEAEARLAEWKRRVDEHQTKVAAARAAGEGVSPAAVLAQLSDDEKPTIGFDGSFELGTAASARRLIDDLGKLIDEAQVELANEEQQRNLLTGLGELPGAWHSCKSRLLAEEANASHLFRELERAERFLAAARSEEAGHTAQLESLRATCERLERLETLARDLIQKELDLPRLQVETENLGFQLAETRRMAESETLRLASARDALESRRTWELQRRGIEDRLGEIAKTKSTLTRVLALGSELTSLTTELASARAAAEESRKALSQAETLSTNARLRREVAEQSAAALRKNATEVRVLVAQLASHLRHEDVECPLCSADYAPGDLLERATRVGRTNDTQLEEAENRLGEARALEAAPDAERAVAASRLKDQDAAAGGLERRIAALEDQLSAARASLPFAPDDLTLGNDLELEEQEKRAILALLVPLPGPASQSSEALETIVRDVERAYATVNERMERDRAALSDAESRSTRMRAAIVAAREQLGIGPGIPAADLHGNLQRQLSEADLALNAAKAEHVRLVERVAEQSSEVAKVITRIQDFKNEITAVKAHSARLEADWERTAIVGEPSTAALQGAIADLERQRAETTARLGVFRRLIAGLNEWLATANLDELSQALDADAGGTGDEAWSQHTRRLASEVEAAKSAKAAIDRVRDAADKMSEAAQKKKATMRDELNTRLGPIFARLLRSLVVDPDIASAVLNLREKAKKTHVNETLADGTTPLAARASEGQLAGVGLAMQLSMALAFPWSRWPAVLLDDPSQFSDVVHASNLVETLRLMARQFGFQIFVSTHERDFARYVQRKFANDGLAATRVLFQPPRDSKSGIIPRVVSGN